MPVEKEKNAENGESVKRWITYRPAIKILDCTIRDGGLINDHKFDDEFVKAVYQTLVSAGVDYMEIGYKASKHIYAPSKYGPWKYCDEDDVRRIIGDNKPDTIKLSVMADAGRTDYKEDILPKEKSVFDCVRIACYIHQIPLAMDMIKDAYDKGYETAVQLMAASIITESEMTEALHVIAHSPADAIYLVDSWGAMYSEEVRRLLTKYIKAMEGTVKEIGFHAHNNMQLAFANTIEAIVAGANRLDATINGIGRGAGNCPLELLIAFLHNPKFRLRPVLQCCRDFFVPLAQKMEWGYRIPYAVTGMLNRHPQSAIDWLKGNTPDDYVAFYDKMIEEES